HLVATARVDPCAAVGRGPPVGVVPAVRDPFADIAGHVVKAECIGRVAADRGGTPGAVVVARERIAPLAPTGRTVTTAGEVARICRRLPVPPREAGLAAGPQHVLELGLAGQAVRLTGLLRQPLGVGQGILCADVDNRVAVPGRLAQVIVAPVDATAANHVATALVIHHRV